MSSTPIRQPRGPPSNTAAFSSGSPTPSPAPGSSPSPSRSTSTGPPPPDAESILRRNKTVSTSARSPAPGFDPATGVSLSHRRSMGPSGASAYPSNPVPVSHADTKPSSGFVVASRYRSGSLSGPGVPAVPPGLAHSQLVPPGIGVGVPAGVVGGSLTRRTSGRDFRALATGGGAEETLLETEAADEHASAATERGTWGKGSGLNRQSSLPSRRLVNGGVNPGLFTPAQPAIHGESPPGSGNNPPPPPRPPRRVYQPSVDQSASTSPPPITGGSHGSHGSHSRSSSHSLSLSMINAGGHNAPYDISPVNSTPASAGHGQGFPTPAAGASVSRTQSLRAQMQSQPGVEYNVSALGRSASMRAPGELAYSRIHASPPPPHPFSAATPPRPSKSTLYPGDDDEPSGEIRRHQSLTYGTSARTRERLERSQALLSLDQREDLRRLAASPSGASATGSADGRSHSRHLSIGMDDSPMGRSVWAPSGANDGDDGWSSSAALQDALESLSISGRDQVSHPHPRQVPTLQHPGEEPAWVTNLVGMPGQPSPQAVQRPLGGWDDRGAPSPYGLPPQWGGGHQLQPPLGLYQQQQLYAQAQAQAQLKLAAAGLGGGAISPLPGMSPMQMSPGYPMTPQGYLGAPFNPTYATPPAAAPPAGPPISAQDLDVLELARSKGLNPATFDCNPPFARFFVIKSYTEDDVQKSLKHGIWSSTVLGNKRLDAAYRESHERGPIYLFFSVNGSRHFCGVAQMTSPVDETRSSNVWAQDKWKGIFSVSWIFVRDISNLALRHIRLNNTPERKPITNTRDTTEVPYENGCEVLQIFLDHQHKSKTSLLQDFAYYERLSASRENTASPQPAAHGHSGHATPTPPMGYPAGGPVPTAPPRVG